MESSIDSQAFEQVEPLIAAFAAAGRREWRDGRIDGELLVALPAVQDQLAAIDGAARMSPDSEANAIEAAIEVAITSLRDPFRSAALDHFGFTDEKIDPMGKGAREKRAAKNFSRGDRWYRKPSDRYLGLSPHDYVIALVASALCGASDPITWLSNRRNTTGQPASDSVDDQPAHDSARRKRWDIRQRPVALAAVLATIGAAVGAWLVADRPGHSGSSSSDKPPVRTSSNTQTESIPMPPGRPTGVTALAQTSSQVNLAWAAVRPSPKDHSLIDDYNIYRNQSRLAHVSGSELRYSDTRVRENTVYRYEVSAVDERGDESARSVPVYVQTPPTRPTRPPAVSLISPTNGARVRGNVRLVARVRTEVGLLVMAFAVSYDENEFQLTGRPGPPGTYTATLTAGSYLGGLYTIQAHATDTAGRERQSAAIKVSNLSTLEK